MMHLLKPHLAAWVDMRSRVIMGDVMCKDANSDILKQSLLKMIYSEPGGVPEYLYIDNGKDYTAKTMTGRDRNDRSGMSFDNETTVAELFEFLFRHVAHFLLKLCSLLRSHVLGVFTKDVLALFCHDYSSFSVSS